jgi:hypothetical protein
VLSVAAAGRFWRQSLVLLFALSLLNASNYAFHVVVSRLLGPAAYSSLASLLAVVLVLSVPFGVLQAVVAQRTAALVATARAGEVPGFAAGALKGLTPVAWLLGAGVALAAPAIAVFLHLGVLSALLLVVRADNSVAFLGARAAGCRVCARTSSRRRGGIGGGRGG